MHRVVMVFCIGWIDGHQRQVAPVLASFQRRGLGLLGLAQRRGREGLGNFVGMNRDQADRLLARERAEPLFHLPGGQPKTARAHQIDADEIAILGAVAVGLGDVQFTADLLLVDRNEPSAAIGQGAEDSEHAGFGVIDHLDDAAAIDGAFAVVQLLDPQQRAVADTCRRARMRTSGNVDADFRRFAVFHLIPFGGRRDQFAVAVAAGDVGHHGCGQYGRLAYLLAALLDRAFGGQLAQDTLELDAVGVLEAKLPRDFAGADFSRMRADEGDKGVPLWKNLVALFRHLSACLAGALLCGGFGRRLRWRGFGRRRYRRAGLAGRGGAIGLRLRRGFLRDRLLGRLANGLVNGFGRLRIRFGRLFCFGRLGGLGLLGAPLRLAAALGDAFVDQRDGFFERDGLLRLVAGDGGVDAARRDIGAVAAALDRDAAKGRMLAQRLAGIGAEAAAARAFQNLLGNQRDRPVEPDIEHFVAGLEAGIGFLVAHERAEAAKTRRDRLAGLRMPADLARQRQQFQRQIKLDIAGRHVLRNAGALRLFALGIILGLAELDVGTEASGLHHDVEIGYRILAEDAVGAGFAVGGERTGVAAFGIIGAADKGAEFSGLEVKLAGTAGRTLPGIAAILARRIDVRPKHVIERIQHLGNAEILDLVDGADEIDPEIPQNLLPGNLVVGDAIELLFQCCGEIILDVAGEKVFQERDHDAAFVLAMQTFLLEPDIAAVLEHLQDRGIGRGTADAEFLHALDQ